MSDTPLINLDDPEFQRAAQFDLERLARDVTPVVLDLRMAEAWILLSTIQLAFCHPGFRNNSAAAPMRDLAARLQQVVCVTDTLARLAAAGWEEQYDATRST